MSAQLLTRPMFWWCISGALALCAVIALMYAVSGASLACVPCDCTYSLSAENARCRRPAAWALAFDIALLAALLSAAVAIWRHWRLFKRRRTNGKAHT